MLSLKVMQPEHCTGPDYFHLRQSRRRSIPSIPTPSYTATGMIPCGASYPLLRPPWVISRRGREEGVDARSAAGGGDSISRASRCCSWTEQSSVWRPLSNHRLHRPVPPRTLILSPFIALSKGPVRNVRLGVAARFAVRTRFGRAPASQRRTSDRGTVLVDDINAKLRNIRRGSASGPR